MINTRKINRKYKRNIAGGPSCYDVVTLPLRMGENACAACLDECTKDNNKRVTPRTSIKKTSHSFPRKTPVRQRMARGTKKRKKTKRNAGATVQVLNYETRRTKFLEYISLYHDEGLGNTIDKIKHDNLCKKDETILSFAVIKYGQDSNQDINKLLEYCKDLYEYSEQTGEKPKQIRKKRKSKRLKRKN